MTSNSSKHFITSFTLFNSPCDISGSTLILWSNKNTLSAKKTKVTTLFNLHLCDFQRKQMPSVLWRDTSLCDESRECAHLQCREAPPHHGWSAQSSHGRSSALHCACGQWRNYPPLSLHDHPSSAYQWGASPRILPPRWSTRGTTVYQSHAKIIEEHRVIN